MNKQQSELGEKWLALADSLRAEANAIPAGRAKDGLLRRIAQLEQAMSIESLLRPSSMAETSDPADHHVRQHVR